MNTTYQTIGISSPTTALPEKQFVELKACIAEANHILRSLGNPSQPTNPRQLELKLTSLKDQYVRIQTSFRGGFRAYEGFLLQAGRNYIQFWSKGRLRYVTFDQLISISSEPCESELLQEPRHVCRSEELNCELLYAFTETVSGSVKLLNRFYGIPLSMALLQHAGQQVVLQLTEPKRKKIGCLVKTTEDKVIIQPSSRHDKHWLESIAFADIEIISISKQ
ncbi:hypothetical protein [Paenibacillus sp. MER 99-2]|uniref:hypothetical protein n=1 Tax=Paenibacillus sp. MER 99-2 TaxID=2939572 RepID=UPI00203EF529|nr:hypothetical protein [Paenibacillus sp. MER 99-2]MCM3172338.1 hypothetical protein [Paenibacillus sp. MER 99-2]